MSEAPVSAFDKFAPWSLSKSDTAGKCGLAFSLNYVHKTPRTTSEAAQVGVGAHRVQELLLQGSAPLAALAQAFEEMPDLTSVEKDKIRELMPAMQKFCDRIAAYIAKTPIKSIEFEKKWAINRQYAPVEWDDPTAVFRGVLDLVIVQEDGYVIVIDHKTGKRRPVDYYAKQLDAYAVLALSHIPGMKGVKGALHYVKTQDLDWHLMRKSDMVKDMLRGWLMHLLRSRAEGLGTFKAKLGKLCGWCDYRMHCEAFQNQEAEKVKAKKELAEEKKAQKRALKVIK